MAQGVFDVAVVGAGVVGCAIARRFAIDGARVLILERAHDVLDGASKGNSAILHTGFDAPEGSLELDCIRAGYAEYREIHARMNLPLDPCGALVLAWTEEQQAALPGLMAQAAANGVGDVEMLDHATLPALESQLAPEVRAGFRVPGEALIDPWSAAHAYLYQAIQHGAELRLRAELLTAERQAESWRLHASAGSFEAGLVVNAAGLWGDHVERILTGESWFQIRPRKGQFILYDKPAAALAGHILLPVPTKVTKGVVVCRTIFGNLLVGPTAEEQEEREDASVVPATLEALRQTGETILPALAGQEVTAFYAGLRPASEDKAYRIRADLERGLVTVGGIRSTGLSAALGIAQHVARLVGRAPGVARDWPEMPVLAQDGARDWQAPGNGGIVCHCELVTRREIAAAMEGPAPAQSLAGLKRRTRVTMGRCQGFYCSAELARLTEGRFTQPMLAGAVDDAG
ncbi:NAD(P)/FAD-dependent oxidoreductase [Paracoccus zhejiangensis]|uniref:FAD/NAD(P)-binding oxidoreductase n=1 Tax=Paracoccus zhejiangensis TaxID=1077935 RepID=A0A2H5F1P4_9RHOB|nr:NAD(P)/FAD-dependent oxidoreductase [Paracoccus zhejiangensis]AUH65447.1 FAD/NAD(P)-binding oxidoreductase [Paracoccus zhejiangensis]